LTHIFHNGQPSQGNPDRNHNL